MTEKMKISIITDELSADPETAVELAAGWGIRHLELRGYFADRVPRISAYQKLRLKQLLERFEASVVAISPGLFKFPYPLKQPAEFPMPWLDQVLFSDWSTLHRQLDGHLNELLPASLDFANELGARVVVSFSFSRGGLPPGLPPDELYETLLTASERARSAGLVLAIENESGFWADTGERTGQLVRAINHPSLGINWDPANAFCEGDSPYPDGYHHVAGLVRHVHFKDAKKNTRSEPEYVLEGDIDWTGQLRGLAEDGYSGFISVETHLRPKLAAARTSLDRLQSLLRSLGQD